MTSSLISKKAVYWVASKILCHQQRCRQRHQASCNLVSISLHSAIHLSRANTPDEHECRRTCRQVFELHGRLKRSQRWLEQRSYSDTRYHEYHFRFPCRRVRAKHDHQTITDCQNDPARPYHWSVSLRLLNDESDYNSRRRRAKWNRKLLDTGHRCTCPEDLEIERNVVAGAEKRECMYKARYQDRNRCPLLKEFWRNNRITGSVKFIDESKNKKSDPYDKRNYSLRRPPTASCWLRKLEAQKQEYHPDGKQEKSDEVKSLCGISQCCLFDGIKIEEENEKEGSSASCRKIDPKTPSPRRMLCQDTSDERADNASYSPCCAN